MGRSLGVFYRFDENKAIKVGPAEREAPLKGWGGAPLFFVSVHFKRLNFPVNSLESTLMGVRGSVDSKWLSS
jgi:hypothetical protein